MKVRVYEEVNIDTEVNVDVYDLPSRELSKAKDLGITSVDQIRERLAEVGMKLRDD